MEQIAKTITMDNAEVYQKLCGVHDQNIPLLEEEFAVRIIPRGNSFIVQGNGREIESYQAFLQHYATHFFDRTAMSVQKNGIKTNGHSLSADKLRTMIYSFRSVMPMENALQTIKPDIQRREITLQKIENNGENLTSLFLQHPLHPHSPKEIICRSENQVALLSSLQNNTISIAIGPAGTGKTFLSVAYALHALWTGQVKRIILTRPAVEAGENLGFLPGDLVQKVDPYLRPLYDTLFDLAGIEYVRKLIADGIIEVAPLAFMRGRTLNQSFIILDEAQNTSIAQMKMFLTRLGNRSRFAISGDATQIDLPRNFQSGLIHAMEILRDIPEIGIIRLTKSDIMRHPLIEKIVHAYEKEK